MVLVDNVGVPVPHRVMPVRMATGFRPLPALMFMAMMLVVDVQVFVIRCWVVVLQFSWVVRRPQYKSSGGRR